MRHVVFSFSLVLTYELFGVDLAQEVVGLAFLHFRENLKQLLIRG